jgi:hypothetical protein
MKNFLIILLAVAANAFSSCFLKTPYATITKDYIKVANPGYVGLAEIKVFTMDSTFGYPAKETETTIYAPVKRRSKADVGRNSTIKMYFKKRSNKHVWQIERDTALARYEYADTIHLKKNTWYRLTTEKYGFDFYFKEDEQGQVITKQKPKPGAW